MEQNTEKKPVLDVTAEQIEEFRDSFNLFDQNGDGHVSKDELRTAMRAMGHNPTDAELDEMMNEVDANGSGTIELPEFAQMMMHRCQEVDEDEQLRKAFKVFDKNGDGFINVNELKYVVTNLGDKMTDAEVQSMLNEADTNGDGQLDYTEFVAMMNAK